MLNFIKKLFGTSATAEVKGVEAKTTLEFHEEIRAQVEAQKTEPFPVEKKSAPAKATATKKAGAKKAPAKPKSDKKPAKKPAKSKQK